MNDLVNGINKFIKDLKIVIKTISKSKQIQIKSIDDREYVSAYIYFWFSSIKPLIGSNLVAEEINTIDDLCSKIILSCKGNPSKTSLISKLKDLESKFIQLSSDKRLLNSTLNYSSSPTFHEISNDPKIQKILTRRWEECEICVKNGAVVASLVMIGGMIEALLMAKVNKFQDKTLVFTAKSAPKDKTGLTLQLKEWTLKDYINVAFELGWIGVSIKDISTIFRDYRNYIHPYKEVTTSTIFQESDINIIWDISKKIISEIS